jgi:hypothetical protein
MSAPDRHLGDAPGHWASRLLGRSFWDTVLPLKRARTVDRLCTVEVSGTPVRNPQRRCPPTVGR